MSLAIMLFRKSLMRYMSSSLICHWTGQRDSYRRTTVKLLQLLRCDPGSKQELGDTQMHHAH
eukprot:6659914-Prorocentrum_lima.AAC.1